MHIHDLYAGRSPYGNIPAPNNVNPVRTFTTVEALLHRINSKINQGKVTEYNAFSMLLAFINESCPKKKELDQGLPILVFDKNLWALYVRSRVTPPGTGGAIVAQRIIDIGEEFFYLGFETGMWRRPVAEEKIQAKKVALDLISMTGVSPEEAEMRFPALFSWIGEEDNEDIPASTDGLWKKNFVPLYDQDTHLFIDQRMGLGNLNHNPEIIGEYVRFLRPITGRETKSKISIGYHYRWIFDTLVRSKLVNVIDLERKDKDYLIVTYTCPVRNENKQPLMGVPIFPDETIRIENKDEEGEENADSETNPAPESVIVF